MLYYKVISWQDCGRYVCHLDLLFLQYNPVFIKPELYAATFRKLDTDKKENCRSICYITPPIHSQPQFFCQCFQVMNLFSFLRDARFFYTAYLSECTVATASFFFQLLDWLWQCGALNQPQDAIQVQSRSPLTGGALSMKTYFRVCPLRRRKP